MSPEAKRGQPELNKREQRFVDTVDMVVQAIEEWESTGKIPKPLRSRKEQAPVDIKKVAEALHERGIIISSYGKSSFTGFTDFFKSVFGDTPSEPTS